MIAVASVMFLVAAGVTVAAAFLLVEEDRGFLFWITTGFVLFVELLAYSFVLGMLTSNLRKDQVSTPMIVASWVVLVIYGFVGAGSIIIYALIRNADDPGDKAFVAVLMIETGVAFLLVLLLRSWDLFFQAGQPHIGARREEHRAKGMTLQPVLARLRTLTCPDPGRALRLDRVAKRLEVVQSALVHSHGGGVGSREAGPSTLLDPAIESEVAAVLLQLQEAAMSLDDSDSGEQRIAQIESLAERLQGFVSRLQLD
jgi:hypothetical protein